jgi:hypothetical protein
LSNVVRFLAGPPKTKSASLRFFLDGGLGHIQKPLKNRVNAGSSGLHQSKMGSKSAAKLFPNDAVESRYLPALRKPP